PVRSFNVELFNPSGSADLGVLTSTTVNILEDDSVVEFESQEFNVVEGVTNARITVVRNGGVNGTVSVLFTTGTNGTARPYIDYIPINSSTNYDPISKVTLVFSPGMQRLTVNIPIIDDFEPEMTETVPLELSNITGPATIGSSNAVLKIIDNDISPGIISFATNYFTVIENFPTAVITLIRTNGYSGIVSVDYTIGGGGTATAGQDYVATNGTVTFAENETFKTFTVKILDDNIIEGNETVLMKLSRPLGGATIGLDTAVLVINDDDSVGGFVFSTNQYVVSEGVGNAVVEVKRVGGKIGQASVTVMTTSGTATPGVDYIGISNVLTFADGETSKLVSIPIIDDAIVETPESIGLILQNPSNGAFIGPQGSAIVMIIDNEVGISLENQSYSVSETDIVAVISVIRIGNTNISVSAMYNTSDGTAIAGSDYRATNGIVTFAPGQTNQFIYVPIIDDTIVKSNELFYITLSGQTAGATLGPIVSAPVVIIENDKQVNFSSPTYT
ncbi:MAG TPA: Calx-beta domain-containing protein, partial [Verrucomicrobiota bacterium]|nr:Calx-beta domain-containing protein [Verrucomicrobiota bacterium]